MSQGYSIADLEAYISRFYQGRPLLITPYGYNLTFTPAQLSAGATVSQVINVAANADFVAINAAYRSFATTATTQTNATDDLPFVRCLITDSGSNEQFTNSAVDISNYGTGHNFMMPLPYPRIVSGRSTLTVQMTNYSSNTAYGLDFFVSGVLVRAYAQQQ
jgi:hypothetical protein